MARFLGQQMAWLLVAVLAAISWAQQAAPGLADGRGGLASLSAEDEAALREVRDMLKNTATDKREPPHEQRAALAALLRIHEALNDWGMEGQLDQYTKELRDESRNADLLVALAAASAKGGNYHLGGVRALWRALDENGGVPDQARRRRDAFLRMCKAFEKPPLRPATHFRPMTLVARKLDPARMIWPYGRLAPRKIDLSKAISPYKQ